MSASVQKMDDPYQRKYQPKPGDRVRIVIEGRLGDGTDDRWLTLEDLDHGDYYDIRRSAVVSVERLADPDDRHVRPVVILDEDDARDAVDFLRWAAFKRSNALASHIADRIEAQLALPARMAEPTEVGALVEALWDGYVARGREVRRLGVDGQWRLLDGRFGTCRWDHAVDPKPARVIVEGEDK